MQGNMQVWYHHTHGKTIAAKKKFPHTVHGVGKNMCVSYGREGIRAYLISRRRLAGTSAAFFGIVSVRTPSV